MGANSKTAFDYGELQFLIEQGVSPEEAARRCGFSNYSTITRWAYRNNNTELLVAFKHLSNKDKYERTSR